MATNNTAPTSASSATSSRSARASIHTPLKPASVQDLKAKFDPGKLGEASVGLDSTVTATSANSAVKTFSPLTERKNSASFSEQRDVSISSSGSKCSSNVTLSSVASSLQASAQRKLVSTSSSSISSSSTLPSSNLRSTTKSSLTLTTARPFSPSSLPSSKSASATNSGRNSPISDSNMKPAMSSPQVAISSRWDPKSVTKSSQSIVTTSSTHSNTKTDDTFSPLDFRSQLTRDKDGRLELPVMHITTSGSDVSVEVKPRSSTLENRLHISHEKKSDLGSGHTDKNNYRLRSTFGTDIPSMAKPLRSESPHSREGSPPVQRTRRLVAREIKIERLESGVNITSYKDGDLPETDKPPAAATKPPECPANVGNKIREIKVERISSEQSSSHVKIDKEQPEFIKVKLDKEQPEFIKVKLRKTKPEQPENCSKLAEQEMSTDNDEKRLSRKISSERFERLVFDFQRGVPTEVIPRMGSENDHIILQQKARELAKPMVEEDVPVIAKKKKEQSIFTEGLKVSDFVKQVNRMNPEVDGPPKWKVQRAQSQTSSIASSDVGGDNFYQGIPGEDVGNISDEDDDIYEKVTFKGVGPTEGDYAKAPERRLGVYRKTKVTKQKEKSKSTKSASDGEDRVIHSDGEGGWENSDLSSSGTEYEDVGPDGDDIDGDCFYEDLESVSLPASEASKNKTFGNKLKNIFHKAGDKNKRSKAQIDSGVSAGTDSEADTVDDTDEVDNDLIETLSRTSSERSSGRLTCDSATLSSISTTTSIATTASNTDETPTAAVNQSHVPMASSNMPPPPPLPPRTTKALNQPPENSPPLPPRNPALSNKTSTLGVTLDTVVPISPSARPSSRAYTNKAKDRFSFGASNQDISDNSKIEYIDYDPASAATLERLERTDSSCRKKKSIFGRKASGSRPSSGVSSAYSSPSYSYPDISAFPELKGDIDDDKLYVDLEDEQIYGRASGIYVSKFDSEPLYQWYSKDKVLQNMRSDKSTTSDELSSDDEYLEDRKHSESVYEDVERLLEKTNSTAVAATKITTATGGKSSDGKGTSNVSISSKDKPQRRSVIEDVFKNGGSLHRALWCQMPEVIESGLLEKLTDQQKKVQEAMFEIITSEASYLKSLKVLISVFLMSPEFSADMTDRCVVSRRDKQVLFSNIGRIKDISEEFLKDLEERWQESCYMRDICDIIYKHASNNFEPYVRYCGNQSFQDRALNQLRQNSEFSEAVKRLEQHSDCQFLPLSSFLLLPMQRITRLPLLVDAIARRLEPGSPAQISVKRAMDSLTKVAKRCDDAAKKMQQTEQMCMLASNLEFKVKEFPLVSASRFLVKQGELTLIKTEGTSRKTLSKLLGSSKEHVHLFLFNDILLVTKKKGNTFQVRDYCHRNALHFEAVESTDKSRHLALGLLTGITNVLFLAMLANHENKQVEMVLSCKSESERTRWIDAIMPVQTTADNERIYDYWDCPQFHCVRKYIAQQPDELTLEESDVINVTRKMTDGWYEGERIRDGAKGWFPASHTEEINNSHVRARNLRLRYRLMRASQEYSHKK